MFYAPKTLEEARSYRYEVWGGQPNGTAYKESRCAYEVSNGGRSVLFRQCLKKNGHGINGLYCKQHAELVK